MNAIAASAPADPIVQFADFERQLLAEAPEPGLKVVNAGIWVETEPPLSDSILDETFDRGDKVAIIGSSKLRKSFFALQLSMHLAAGIDFLNWTVRKPRRVLLVQLEIKSDHFHRRVKRMAMAMGIAREDLRENLMIVNGRGQDITLEAVGELARSAKPDVIVFDPLYKLVNGDENSAEDMKPVLAGFDRLAEATGATVAYVHHDAKGNSGDRNIRDRGAGSGVIGRDYDCCITLTAHRDDLDAVVIEVLLRNYKPQEAFSIGWDEGRFRLAQFLEAAPVTSRNQAEKRQRGPDLQDIVAKVKNEMLIKPLRVDALKAQIQSRFNVGRTRSQDACRLLESEPGVQLVRTATFPVQVLIGPTGETEKEAARLTSEWRTRKLPL